MLHLSLAAGSLLNKPVNKILFDAVLLLLGSALAGALALLARDAVIVEGGFLPYGNDAFYHAYRVLDALTSGGGLQEFDPQMHVPEGSWLTWPWGYDYLLLTIAQVAVWFSPSVDPMRILIYVPVVWIPVNIFLLLGIFNALDLRPEFKALGIAGFALLPLTQRLHGIGAIDHHFMELTFVLLVAWLLLRWMSRLESRGLALSVGMALGCAQAFHHGLFTLQLPVLAAVFILWLRGIVLPAAVVRVLAAAILVSTLLIALPSGPLLDGQFLMATLSLFHVYIAFATAVLLCFMSLKPYSRYSLTALGCIALLLTIPVVTEVTRGAQFIAGELGMLDQIIEMASPLRMITGSWGFGATVALYSGLLLLAPVLLIASIWIAVMDRRPVDIAYGVLSVFGLGLLLMQLRLNYFGVGFLLAGPLYFVSRFAHVESRQRLLVFGAMFIIFVLAFRPPLTEGLFRERSIAGDHLYEVTRPLYPALQAACAAEPGLVAAAAQFGHYIRFHTDCSVIANNFLLTEQHFEKVRWVNSLFHLSVDQLMMQAPDVRYVLGFLSNTYEQRGTKVYMRDMSDIRGQNPLLINQLMLNDQPRTDTEVLVEVFVDPSAELKIPLAGVYRIRTRP
jgi:asparagine N-glycosylation enzyme membrane subunit Stt3